MEQQIICEYCGKPAKQTDGFPVCDPYCEPAKIRSEPTEAGNQIIIGETPQRTVPTGALRPKKIQKTTPLALEMPAIEASQPKLF